MEVREAYAAEDFEWEQLKRLATRGISDGNLRLMRQRATASLRAEVVAADGAGSTKSDGGNDPIDKV